METPLVSIIMAAFNAENFISDSINSVLSQTYSRWELIIVNDGSNDNTENVVKSFKDLRIRYFKQENRGVSVARNKGLIEMRGTLFCFLDSDDLLTPNSLFSRVILFQKDATIGIVDGTVIVTEKDINKVLRIYKPEISGRVQKYLALLSEKVYCMPSVMIRREVFIDYKFDENMTHAEDLWFILNVHYQSKLNFSFTTEPIIYYRRIGNTAMANLKGLGRGYILYYKHVKEAKIIGNHDLRSLKFKIVRIMVLSYLRFGNIVDAFKFVTSFIFSKNAGSVE